MTIRIFCALSAIAIAATSCDKDDDDIYTPPAATVVKEWSIALSTKNENPAPAARNETGTATLQLFSDNSLKYTINVIGLASGDALSAAHIHTGNVVVNGPVILGLSPTFTGSTATGTITNLRTSFVDSLKSDVNELYFNVHSTQVASGLVRGQLNTNLDMVADVALSGANEVPAIITTATGTALLRLTTKKELFVRVSIASLEANDTLAVSHIHRGAAGANGGILLDLYANAAEFGTVKVITVTDAQIATLKNDALYVNVHSRRRPSGIVRGQIR